MEEEKKRKKKKQTMTHPDVQTSFSKSFPHNLFYNRKSFPNGHNSVNVYLLLSEKPKNG